MGKEYDSQLDLFSQAKDVSGQPSAARIPILRYLHNSQKLIFFIITYLITGIISFSIGIEKGRQGVLGKYDQRVLAKSQIQRPSVKTYSKTAPQLNEQAVLSSETKSAKIEPAQSIPEKSPYVLGKYTIQVASFRTSKLANKEAGILRKKGFSSNVSVKGKYSVVYVGNFTNKKVAASTLSRLKKKYSDCFIRRL